MADQLDVVERILQILQGGAYTSTYKFAVLVALMDLCVENTSAMGWPPTTVTTRQLAEKVVELYWLQVRAWEGRTLKQNRGRQGVILREIAGLREIATIGVSPGASLGRVRLVLPDEVERVVRTVEWKLIEMPLPKLQRVAGVDTGWLYSMAWDDASCPTEGTVRAYQRSEASSFDNRIQLRPEVAMAFVRLHGLLRPFVEQRWAMEVARINNLEQDRLQGFLFGADRISLEPVRGPLYDLQGGACFYCQRRVRQRGAQVDHFLPWARHCDNGLDNLVVAHAECNGDKSDHLAGHGHLERWRQRREDEASALAAVAAEAQWDPGGERTLGAARALYLRLPAEARLWRAVGAFEVVEPRLLLRVLG